MGLKSKDDYKTTHIGTKRYQCKSQWDSKNNTYVYPIVKKGNYEPLLSFKALPPYRELQKKGRKWIHTKNYKPVMDRIFLDIDCEDGLETAFKVTEAIMQDLEDIADCINIYFSGSKGFHIEILTEELDIIDTTVKKPMDSCYQYVEFLNYYMDKYPEVDLSLKDVGTRILRIPHTKHEKTGNYKILVDINASLEDIITSSKDNKDMVEPAQSILNKEKALLLMNTYKKPVTRNTTFEDLVEVGTSIDDDSIYAIVFNEMNTNIHNKIGMLGSGLNGYVSKTELKAIYQYLTNTTDIESSNNAEQSFYDAYDTDKIPCNIGAIKEHYINNGIDLENFYNLSEYLDSKLQSKSYNEFNSIFEIYEYNAESMLDDELYDYVDNSKNVFNGIIQSLSALFGYGSRFIVVNGGAEVGKSEYINTIKKLIPNRKFKNLGSSTPATIRRSNEFAFKRKVVYLGDKGLKGKDDDEFKGLQEVFGGLITEKEFKRDVMVGDKVMKFNLQSDGVCVFYTEPYTNLRVFGAGDQYSTRSTFITVNPVKDGLAVFLQDNSKENPFYLIHRNYISYILNNPIELKINDPVKTKLYEASKGLRTAKYLLGLFQAYCQYMQNETPGTEDVEKFLEVFAPQFEVTQIELMVYEKLYDNLNAVTNDDLEFKLADDGAVSDSEDMLLQVKGRKEKTFFTAKQIKTYFKRDFQNNKNLKDTIDQIPDILHNLYNANYIERLDWQYNGQNVYYLPKNEDMGN